MSGTKLFKYEKQLWEEHCSSALTTNAGVCQLSLFIQRLKGHADCHKNCCAHTKRHQVEVSFLKASEIPRKQGRSIQFWVIDVCPALFNSSKAFKTMLMQQNKWTWSSLSSQRNEPFYFSPHKSIVYLSACSVLKWRLILIMTQSLLNLCLVNLYY